MCLGPKKSTTRPDISCVHPVILTDNFVSPTIISSIILTPVWYATDASSSELAKKRCCLFFWVVMWNIRIIGSRRFEGTNRFQESLNSPNKYRNHELSSIISAYHHEPSGDLRLLRRGWNLVMRNLYQGSWARCNHCQLKAAFKKYEAINQLSFGNQDIQYNSSIKLAVLTYGKFI